MVHGLQASGSGLRATAALIVGLSSALLTAQTQPSPGVKATVLIFVSTDCPVANRYAPEITRLYEKFRRSGVRFQLVYPNPHDDAAAIDAHIASYRYPNVAARDPEHRLVARAGATVTPEAAVFDGRDQRGYSGRIDNRVVELGRERLAATEHDLRNALTAILDGKPVALPRTQAVGCFIADMK
jgi:hypothetical protein